MSTTIGVFDSGFGGLTVLRELLPLVPGAHYLYLGDSARLPYGSKSQATIARYAVESALFLVGRGAQHLVIACNTASALAMQEIQNAVDVPVTGVIEPAVATARQRYPGADVLVLATSATVHSHAYLNLCAANGLRATEKACPLLVPLVEEGWTDHPVTHEVLRIYLGEALGVCAPKAALLGCTHYPLIASAIEATLREFGCNAGLIDSAKATALAVAQSIAQPAAQSSSSLDALPATFQCFATDSVEKFQRLGSQFLGRPVGQVELVDLGG
jgi:glutamate racemase